MTRAVFEYDKDNRPRAEIIIQNGKHKLHLFPVIDSGADITMIPKDVGEDLRLEPPRKKEIEEIIGVGGVVKCVRRNIKIEIGDYHFFLNSGWLFEDEGFALLGRDVFERFDILFKQSPHKKIILDSDKKAFGF